MPAGKPGDHHGATVALQNQLKLLDKYVWSLLSVLLLNQKQEKCPSIPALPSFCTPSMRGSAWTGCYWCIRPKEEKLAACFCVPLCFSLLLLGLPCVIKHLASTIAPQCTHVGVGHCPICISKSNQFPQKLLSWQQRGGESLEGGVGGRKGGSDWMIDESCVGSWKWSIEHCLGSAINLFVGISFICRNIHISWRNSLENVSVLVLLGLTRD